MKKALILFGILMFFCSVSWGNDFKNNQKMSNSPDVGHQNEHKEKNEKEQKEIANYEQKDVGKDKKFCEQCEIEDDEYFTYNQCFFDKQFRKMKKDLCLTRRQEKCIDEIYLNFKFDMENLYLKYQKEKACLLSAIECNCGCLKENKQNLKEYKKEAKAKYKDFKEEIKELLCKNQRTAFKKFQKEEMRKINKIKKYCIVYKFPCGNCKIK